MYPVLSTLRRFAASYIYLSPEMVISGSEGAYLQADKPANVLDLQTGRWQRPESRVFVMEVRHTSSSSADAAISIAKKENEIAEKIRAKDAIYTLVFGPESESTDSEGKVTRVCRYAVVQGVFRASQGTLVQRLPKTSAQVNFRKSSGAIRL
jgi:hypothetical protein